jgi:2-polyprenyl-3-methyl-5-hydroxy-6-metoxy-1,4-benzoquinol methylase
MKALYSVSTYVTIVQTTKYLKHLNHTFFATINRNTKIKLKQFLRKLCL